MCRSEIRSWTLELVWVCKSEIRSWTPELVWMCKSEIRSWTLELVWMCKSEIRSWTLELVCMCKSEIRSWTPELVQVCKRYPQSKFERCRFTQPPIQRRRQWFCESRPAALLHHPEERRADHKKGLLYHGKNLRTTQLRQFFRLENIQVPFKH